MAHADPPRMPTALEVALRASGQEVPAPAERGRKSKTPRPRKRGGSDPMMDWTNRRIAERTGMEARNDHRDTAVQQYREEIEREREEGKRAGKRNPNA